MNRLPLATDRGPSARRGPVLTALAVGVALLLISVAALAARSSPRTETRIVLQPADRAPVSTPGDCPYTVTCMDLDADPAAIRAVEGSLPAAAIVSSYALGLGPLRTLQYVSAETSDGIELTVQSKCASPADRLTSRTLAPFGSIGPLLVSAVLATGPGCSVGLVAEIPAGVVVPRTALNRLLADPRVRLSG